MNTRDILVAAKAKIDHPQKWIKRSFCTDNGRCCALGAIYQSVPSDDYFVVRANLAEDALCSALPATYRGRLVIAFNDDPSTTHADIMALFDRAIKLAEHSHG